jgi:Ser/Thr protein kinase RdoA (MazF antagonist)
MDTALSAVLSAYPAVARPSAEPEPLGNAGGLSGSRLWRYPSGLGLLLARAWPVDGPTPVVLEQIQRWLVEVGDLGIVPVPVPRLDGRTLSAHAGQFWELTPWLPGTPARAGERDPILVRAATAALGAFHGRLARHASIGPSPGIRVRLAECSAWLIGGFDTLDVLLNRAPAAPEATLARSWLNAARPRAREVLDRLHRAAGLNVPRQPCWRDARPEHFLFRGNVVTGLIDFGAMGIDSVAADLARLLSEWLPNEPNLRAVALSSYSSIRPLAADETALIECFELSSRLLLGGHWARWHFLEGRPFTDPDAIRRGLAKGVESIDRL